jgi:type IV secretory pathway VirJ component
VKRTLLALLVLVLAADLYATEEVLRFGRFGTITVYRESPRPGHVVLFVSGDGGWNLGVIDMARELAVLDALVVGIDIRHFLNELEKSAEKCSYPAADFEALSKYVQKRYDFPRYVSPVLVGYSSGATLVYATLVQAPATTFRGAVSLGFCPDLPLNRPFCRGNGLEWKRGPKGKGYSFLPATNLEVPWIALQGTVDQVCDPRTTENYVRQVKLGEIFFLPKVGHGFAVPRNWMPQFKQAFSKIIERKLAEPPPPTADVVKDLPLIAVSARGPGGNTMAVIITGDGGWGVTDRGLAEALAAQAIPVVGLNSLQYFWTRRTPEGASADLARVLDYYFKAWNKGKAILIGYSLGADVLPFMLNRLPKEMLGRVQLVALLGPGRMVDFEFHLTDWVAAGSRTTSLPVLPEIEKLRGMKMVCFYGTDDEDALCKSLDPHLARVIALEGGHRFGGRFEPIADAILKEAQ